MNPLNPRSKIKENLFKLISVGFGLFLAWLLLEVSMRLISVAWSDQLLKTKLDANTSQEDLVILALGESTTAGIGYGDGNLRWPMLLERELKKKYPGKTFKVVNAGTVGATSQFVIDAFFLRYQIEKPNLVISMLGVNDIDFILKKRYKFKSIKLFDILKETLAYHYYSYSQNCLHWGPEQLKINESIHSELSEAATAKKTAGMQEVAKKYLEKYPKQNFYINFTVGVSELNNAEESQKICGVPCAMEIKKSMDDGFDRLRLVRKLCPADTLSMNVFVAFAGKYGFREEAADSFLEYAEHGGIISQSTLDKLSGWVISNNKLKMALASAEVELITVNAFDFTQKSFITLENFLSEKSVPLIVMSYPSVPIDAYKNVFSEDSVKFDSFRDSFYHKFNSIPVAQEKFKNLYFVSNENFNEVVTSSNYNYYYIDNFCGKSGCKFGHTRLPGNLKIVENILIQQQSLIEKLLSDKKFLEKSR